MDTAYWPPAQMCSFVCTVDADCPAIEGQSAVCQAFVGEGRRMCALPCDPDADVDTCPLATSCETAERYDGTEVSLCLPY